MASKVLTLAVVAAALCAGVASHTWHTGRTCPDIEPYPNLSTDKVMGTWYVVYQFDTSNTCLVWNITRLSDDTLQLTESRQLSALDALSVDHRHHVTAIVDVPNPEVPARMRIRWPTSLTGKADFIVFDTDYSEYMAVFECDRAGLLHRRSVTLLGRASAMNQMFVDRAKRILDKTGIPHSALNIVDHNTCRDTGRYNWHIDGELFGLIPNGGPKKEEHRLDSGVEDYDISQLEILGDGVAPVSKGSVRQP